MAPGYIPEEGFIDRSSVDRRSGRDRRSDRPEGKGPVERQARPRRKANREEASDVFRYRPLATITDLFWSFRTRYQVYRDVGFIPPNDDALDIDAYDLRSVHLGVFMLEPDGEERLIGTIRHVTWEASPLAADVLDLARGCREPALRSIEAPSMLLPMFESFDMPVHEQAMEKVRGGDRAFPLRPFEVSRLTVLPAHWHKGITRGLHELVTLFCRTQGYLHKDAVIATHPHNARKYGSMGFAPVPGTGEIVYKGLRQPAVALEFDLRTAYEQHPYYRPCATVERYFAERGHFHARY